LVKLSSFVSVSEIIQLFFFNFLNFVLTMPLLHQLHGLLQRNSEVGMMSNFNIYF